MLPARMLSVALLAGFLSPAHSQCRDWMDALAQSFLSKRTNPAAFQRLSAMTADEYLAERAGEEQQGVQQLIWRANPSSPALSMLKPRLRQFYQIGAALYGVDLDPEKIYVLPEMTLNAIATGGHIFFYEGLLLYYTDPMQFLVRARLLPPRMTREEYIQLASRYNWRNDWNSLYFVLAHEAAHNLMRHMDEWLMDGMREQLQDVEAFGCFTKTRQG
jgi:hypothetical protein